MAPFESNLDIEVGDDFTEAQRPVGAGKAGSVCADQRTENDQHIGNSREREESKGQTARFQRVLGVEGGLESPARQHERFQCGFSGGAATLENENRGRLRSIEKEFPLGQELNRRIWDPVFRTGSKPSIESLLWSKHK